MNDPYTCSFCLRDDLVLASGQKTSPILVIGGFPGTDEIKRGKPLVGRTGTVLRMELARVGVDLNRMRLTNLWLHPKLKPKDVTYQDCFDYGFEEAVKEAKGRKLILLIGADAVKTFTGYNVSEVTGLVVPSKYLSAKVMCMVQPTTVFKESLGEVRLSLKKFSKEVDKVF